MANSELHIIVKEAGDPERLGALLNAAIDLKEQERPTRVIVPNGYRCIECYNDDGSHALTCSMFAMALETENGEAAQETQIKRPERTHISTGVQQGA